MPAMIDHLNAEVRGLQERLRQKRAAADAAERRAAAAEARLAPLLLRRERQRKMNSTASAASGGGDSGDHLTSQPTETPAVNVEVESLKASIEVERSKLRVRLWKEIGTELNPHENAISLLHRGAGTHNENYN